MTTLSEAFLPTDWDEFDQAIAQRDQKAAQLSAQGLICTCRTLYRITDGMPVYVVEASKPELEPDARRERESSRRREPRRSRSERTPARKRSPGALEGKFKPKTLGYQET